MGASIHIVRFWQNFRPDKNDPAKLVAIDMVAYGPVGQTNRTLVHSQVKHISNVRHSDDDQTNPAVVMAQARWDAIRPAYEAWKSGQEMPVDGTPLAAWNGVSPEQAEVLKSRGVKTVEAIAEITDAAIQSIPVPHLRELKRAAQRFLDSADATRFAEKMAEKDRALEGQQLQISEQTGQIANLLAKVNELAEMVAKRQAPDEDAIPPRRPPPDIAGALAQA